MNIGLKLSCTKLFLALSLISCSLNALAEQALTFGYSNLAPFAYYKDGKHQGIELDRTRFLFNRLSIPLVFEELPLKRLYRSLADGSINMMVGSPHVPVLKDKVLWTASKTSSFTIVAVHLPETAKLSGVNDLIGKDIGQLKPYSYPVVGKFIQDKKLNTKSIRTSRAGLGLISKKRLEYFIAYYEDLIRNHSDTLIKYELSELFRVDLHYMVSKKTRNADKIIKRISQEIEEMHKEEKASNASTY